MKTISFSFELLKPFLWCYFNKFLTGKILNNLCSSWTSCWSMIISFITKVAFLLIALINKMCTIPTSLSVIWVLFAIPFLFRLRFNLHPLLLHFQILLKQLYQFHPLFIIIICLFTQLWQSSCYSIISSNWYILSNLPPLYNFDSVMFWC